jgi:hypothetical protein
MRAVVALLLCLASQAYIKAASPITVTVPGGAGPWEQSLNPAFNYGVQDNLPPVVIDTSSGLDFTSGARITLKYVSGLVADSSGPGAQFFDANGGPMSFPTNTYTGANGNLPAYYMNPTVPVYLTELVGTFANNGVIVGVPFAIGDGPTTVPVPSGANQLLLGVNDNLYGAPSPNQGSFVVEVEEGCGDERDQIIQEYQTQANGGVYATGVIDSTSGASFIPSCQDFTQSAHTLYFSFADLNQSSTTLPPQFTWALVRSPLTMPTYSIGLPIYGGGALDNWAAQLVPLWGPRHINTAYRNPSRNILVGGVQRSRHMFGDAIDLRNESRTLDEWTDMVVAAILSGNPWIEPLTGPCGIGCVHADWRRSPGAWLP